MLNDKKMQEKIKKEKVASHTAMCHAVADPGVLARIMQTVAQEYADFSVEDIQDNYLLKSTLTVMARFEVDIHEHIAFQAIDPGKPWAVVDFCVNLDVHGGYDPDLYVEETGEHDPKWIVRNHAGVDERLRNMPRISQMYEITVLVDKDGMAGMNGCILNCNVALIGNKQAEPNEPGRNITPVIVMLPDNTGSQLELIHILQVLCIPEEGPVEVAAALEAHGIRLGLETEGWLLNMYRHLKALNDCYWQMTNRKANLVIVCELLANGKSPKEIHHTVAINEAFIRAVAEAAKKNYSTDGVNLDRIYTVMDWDWDMDSHK